MDRSVQEYVTLARELSASGCYSKSFDLYLMAFDKCAEAKAQYDAEFRVVLNRFNEILAVGNKMEDIFNNFRRALEAFPDNIYYLNDIGRYLYRFKFYNEAWQHFAKAISLDSSFVNAEKNLNSLKNLLIERWHFRMLNDKIRNEAYRDAIRQVLIPLKDRVLDLGSGTGLLSMYAYEYSPVPVIACDGSEVMTKLAESITVDSGFSNIKILNKMIMSLNYEYICGKCSLLVTEMFDAGLFGEHVLQSLVFSWLNLIDDGGRVIPNKAEFFVIGAKCDYLNLKYQLSSAIKSQLNVGDMAVHVHMFDETYDCEDVHVIKDIKYITKSQSVAKIDFNNYRDIVEKLKRTSPYEVELDIVEDGEVNVVIGWFNLYLTDQVTITTDPRSEKRANAWQQAIFCDNRPMKVQKDDTVVIDFLMNGGKLTMKQTCNADICRISPETLRFLNDNDYMKQILGCIGMACIYLGQIAEMSQINIIDLCPFPMFGLQLLKRGAQSLICTAKTHNDKQFFKKVFKANHIPLTKVTILVGDDWSQEVFKDEKFHAIFCNIFELCGEIDFHFKEIAQHLKQNHLLQGGLFMPAKVNLIGQVVSSHWLDINNRVYDKNVNNYKIATHINKFQVSQNFSIDFTHLEYSPLTDPVVLGECNTIYGSEIINVSVIENGYANAILCWYSIELMEDLSIISTNRPNSFIDGMAFLADPPVRVNRRKFANILRCVDPDGSFKLLIDNDP